MSKKQKRKARGTRATTLLHEATAVELVSGAPTEQGNSSVAPSSRRSRVPGIGGDTEESRSTRAAPSTVVQGWPNDPDASNVPITQAVSVGGRLSVDTPYQFFGSPHVVLPPINADQQWGLFHLDDRLVQTVSPTRLAELLADVSPDVSRALWDFLRLCNPGWSYCVMTARKNGQPDLKGQAIVDGFIDKLTDLYGSMDVVINRLFIAAFLRGALMAELVLDLDGRTMVDFATPDPATVRFIKSQDSVRGMIWQLAQWQNRPSPIKETVAGYVPLLWPTIKYIPIDPFPGIPYGRSIANAAIFTTLFLLGLFHDLRRVISQQGYPRLDISVSMERLKASMPAKILNDPKEYKQWVNDTIAEVAKAYARLKPDSTYVHTDVVTVNRPVGTVDASSLGAIDGIITALERMSVRALKTMPFMMASTQTTTETLANREWEVQSAGIKSIQKHGVSILTSLLELGMRAQGHVGCVCWSFDTLRKTEAIRDAQAQAITVANFYAMWAHGWITMDEASNALVGHDAVADEPEVMMRGDTMMDMVDKNQPRDDGNPRQRPEFFLTDFNGDPIPFPEAAS